MNKRYNDKAEKNVGKRLLSENFPKEEELFPPIKRIGEVFEGTYKTGYKTGEWLDSSIKTPEVTLAMSLYGTENLIYLYYDAPDLYERFSRTILRVILKMGKIMDKEAGYQKDKVPPGFSFADDDCCLLTPEMYEKFGYPVLKGVFEYYSPEAKDMRYQHSDSDMAHLLPILSKVNLTGCNFGPTVLVERIRKYMPGTRIDGCLAPFTFMRNN